MLYVSGPRKKSIHATERDTARVRAAFVEAVQAAMAVSGDVVVLSNLPAHEVAGLAETVEAGGARQPYLPPYSPDFNPIELAFS